MSDSAQKKLGDIGEKIVLNWLSSLDISVNYSVDLYDSEKDFIFDGDKKGEVKTQAIFATQRALSIRPNQLRKLRKSDMIFFVCSPAKNPQYSSPWEGCVFQVDPKTFKYREYITSSSGPRYLIAIDQEAVQPLFVVSEEEMMYMQPYAS